MDATHLRKILWAYFEGKATPPQKRLLSEWLKATAHQETFYEVMHEWEKANPQIVPDLAADWEEVLVRLQERPEESCGATPVLATTRRRPMMRKVAVAAMLLLAAGWWQRENILYTTYETGFGSTRSFTLADGSKVTLNANSRLLYPRFTRINPNREARLWGEAEFAVVHEADDRPFLVRTPDRLEVRVLGTEFVVYSREEESKVVLTKGKVQLRSLKTDLPSLDILPGDIVTIDRKGTFKKWEQGAVEQHLAWKEHRFVFDRTPLSVVARQIRERFGVEVIIPDTILAARTLSGNFPAETADDVIAMLTRLLNVQSVKLEDKKYRINL